MRVGHSAAIALPAGVLNSEVISDEGGRLTSPIAPVRYGRAFFVERVADTAARSTIAMQQQKAAGERVADRVEPSHRVNPSIDR